MIIWLASYPRSGNTLTRILLHGMYGVKTHSTPDRLLSPLAIAGSLGMVFTSKIIRLLPAFRKRPQRYFIKTHAVLDHKNHIEEDDRAIYIIRDGRDTLVSRAHFYADAFPEYRGQFEKTLHRLVVGDMPCRPWGQSVMTWADRPRTAYLHYEDLVAGPVKLEALSICRAMEALGVSISRKDIKIPKFASLHKSNPVFFRKGKAGAWREEMPEDLQKIFWENNQEGMEYYGYLMDSFVSQVGEHPG